MIIIIRRRGTIPMIIILLLIIILVLIITLLVMVLMQLRIPVLVIRITAVILLHKSNHATSFRGRLLPQGLLGLDDAILGRCTPNLPTNIIPTKIA